MRLLLIIFLFPLSLWSQTTDTTASEEPVKFGFQPNTFCLDEPFPLELRDTNVSELTFRLFDRWGELLVEVDSLPVIIAEHLEKPLGSLKEGVYVWQVILRRQDSTEEKQYHGHATYLGEVCGCG